MSKSALYRHPADCNPLDTEKVPAERLETAFPVRSAPQGNWPWVRLLLYYGGAVFLSFAWMMFRFPGFHTTPPGMMLIVLIGFTFFMAVVGRFESANARLILSWPLVVTMPHVVRWLIMQSSLNPGQMAFAYVLLLIGSFIYAGDAVRRHWVGLCTAGMTPKEVAREFRRKGKLPAGLKPRSGGFKAAVYSFLSYDPAGCKAKGVYRSQHGRTLRHMLLVAPTMLVEAVILQALVSNANSMQLDEAAIFLGCAVFLPALMMLFVCWVFLWDVADKGYALLKTQFTPHHWPKFVHDLQGSANRVEKESLYLARVAADGSPVLVPNSVLLNHAWIQGATGGGKTTMLAQILEQLIEQAITPVLIDNKGTSHELLWSAYAAVDRVKQSQGRDVPVYPITSTDGLPSYVLDIHDQPFWRDRSAREKASSILGMCGLNYPSVYGQDWFRDTAWAAIHHTAGKYPNIRSFYELGQRLDEELRYAKDWELSRRVKEAADHPKLMLDRVGLVDSVNFRPSFSQDVLKHAVNLESLFQTPSVLYCALPSEQDPVANPEIARMIQAAIFSTAAHLKQRPVKVIILNDEFQRMASRSVDLVIQQARSSGVGLVFANQTVTDLQLQDCDLASTLAGNTALRMWLKTPDSKGRELLVKKGGQYIEYMISRSRSVGGKSDVTTTSVCEHIVDRVSSGLIDQVDSSNQFFLDLTQNAGYAAYGSQMFVAEMSFHITQQEHAQRSQTGRWVSQQPGMIINGQHNIPPGPSPQSLTGPKPSSPSPGSVPLGPSSKPTLGRRRSA